MGSSELGRRGNRVRALAAAAAVLAFGGIPSAAFGDVLVNAIEPTTVACGAAVMPGIWYQSFSGGPRWAHITIKTSRGAVVWQRNANATTTWRYWQFRGKCGSSYVLIYQTAAGTARFRFRVRAG
jgi:hypothetical protein